MNSHLRLYTHTVADALLEDHHERGINICMVTDRPLAKGKSSCIPHLAAEGIPMKTGKGKIMHYKVMVANEAILITGSFNWSTNAKNSNQENLLRISSAPLLAALHTTEIKKF